MSRKIISAAICMLTVALLLPGQACAQNAQWPEPGETGIGGTDMLQVYGTGAVVAAMREAATEFGHKRGVMLNITAGPAQAWKQKAIRDGDIIFTDSEYDMTSLAQRDMPDIIDMTSVRSLSLSSSAIIVHAKNPKNIRGIKDLGKQGIKLLTVAGPDQQGMWEEAAKRAGGDKLVEDMRRNMGVLPASKAEAQALWMDDSSYDAWLVIQPGLKDSPKVITRMENTIYRACVMAVTNRTQQKALALEFMDFAESPQGQSIFLKWSGQTK